MSELKDKIRADLKTSMKAKEKERTGTIRMLLAAIQAEETTGAKHEVSDEDILKVVAREIKKRRESAEIYAANDRQELADAELAEVAVLEEYQPAQLDDAALTELVDAAVAHVAAEQGVAVGEVSMKQMGQVMKAATAAAAGQADGKRLSAAVKDRLSS
ncbi:GatB/YqeY domain-containing protein [Corynebacterium suedekumii]|uniref:GatB/YqeY domain-containing protein n=1 Tax=Corynebacterium suedekumii TaxID=3049801 RepID=A0ABY8VNC3_9CORY|nr:GatB/YqeY domain-containing protein [Corynebacterium suedekumii]WIM71156.1 GatB/YqeY domain-containing protein [Corynebacterium suedekumii]